MITAQKGGKTRRFGVLQWNRLVKANKTEGWVEVKGGAQPPRSGTPGASPNKAFSPPEVTEFPLKTRQEIEDGIRAQVEAENKKKLEDMQAQIDQLLAAKTPAPAAPPAPAKTEEPAQTDPGKDTTETAGKDAAAAAKTEQAKAQTGNPNQAKPGANQSTNKAGQGNQAGGGKGGGK